MKKISYILILTTISFFSKGQVNLFPYTFPQTSGYKSVSVFVTCNSCTPKMIDEFETQYLLDEKGYNTVTIGFFENKPCGKQKYIYSKEGKLLLYQNYSTLTSFGMESTHTWDSTLLTNEIKYEYKGQQLVNIKWFDGLEYKMSLEVNYTYNTNGTIRNIEIKNYPNGLVIGQFDSNSAKLTENKDSQQFYITSKTYEYFQNKTIVKYFNKGKLSGIETIEKNRNDKITNIKLTDPNGKVLYKESNTYNDKDQLIESSTVETGMDGFGNSGDFSGGYDKILYFYDSTGFLISKKIFASNKLYMEERLEYKK